MQPADRKQTRMGLHLSIMLCCSGWLSSSGRLRLAFLTPSPFHSLCPLLSVSAAAGFNACLSVAWIAPDPSSNPIQRILRPTPSITSTTLSTIFEPALLPARCSLISCGRKTSELQCSLQEVIRKSHYMLHVLLLSPSTGTSGPCFQHHLTETKPLEPICSLKSG